LREKRGDLRDRPGAEEEAITPPEAPSPAAEAAGEAEETGLAPVEGSTPGKAARATDELEALRRERDEMRDQLLRRRAEFENYRKRVERDRSQAGFEAAAEIFREIVGTIDNLERALSSGAGEGALREGVELTYRELLTFLESQGVEVHDPVGRPFDPQAHQALMHEAVPGFPEGTVVEVFRKGYSYKDRLLRPALVKVAKGEEEGRGTDLGGGIH
jgi:molecular chaperone GrpE